MLRALCGGGCSGGPDSISEWRGKGLDVNFFVGGGNMRDWSLWGIDKVEERNSSIVTLTILED